MLNTVARLQRTTIITLFICIATKTNSHSLTHKFIRQICGSIVAVRPDRLQLHVHHRVPSDSQWQLGDIVNQSYVPTRKYLLFITFNNALRLVINVPDVVQKGDSSSKTSRSLSKFTWPDLTARGKVCFQEHFFLRFLRVSCPPGDFHSSFAAVDVARRCQAKKTWGVGGG